MIKSEGGHLVSFTTSFVFAEDLGVDDIVQPNLLTHNMKPDQLTMAVVPRRHLSPLELLKESAKISGGHVEMPVKCDRCDRRIDAPVSREWLCRMSEAEGRYPVPGTRFWPFGGGDTGKTTIRISPHLCPGYNDGSCLAKMTPEYIKTWENLKPLPGVFEMDKEWLRRQHPPAEGYFAPPEWQDRPECALRTVADLTLPYARYLHWRFAWHLFWHHRGMRHENAPLERMWGNVAADVLLWQLGLLEDADLEALYCTSVGSLVGLLLCRWDYGLAAVEMFFAIRRDLDKQGFNPLKSAVQRADTAMRGYLKACVRGDGEEEHRQRGMAYEAFLAVEIRLQTSGTEEQYGLFAKLRSIPGSFPDEALGLYT